jgi:hypothetical protein
MYYSLTIISLIEVVLVLVPALVGIAYVTIAERKTMASMQRRLGPNQIGYLGLLQAFADALKLLLKEYVAPTQLSSFNSETCLRDTFIPFFFFFTARASSRPLYLPFRSSSSNTFPENQRSTRASVPIYKHTHTHSTNQLSRSKVFSN